MISTSQALAVALLALLPGASYTFAFVRRVGGFGMSLSDRLVRLLAASALFSACSLGQVWSPTAITWRRAGSAAGR